MNMRVGASLYFKKASKLQLEKKFVAITLSVLIFLSIAASLDPDQL